MEHNVMQNNPPRQSGFTLVELVIVMTLTAILLIMALPAFGDLVISNRITTQANTIMATLNYARNEAINRGIDIRIEPVATGTLPAGMNWSAGWQVNTIDTTGATVTTLRHFDALEESGLQNTLLNITYNPQGHINGGDTATLTLQADSCETGRPHIREIEVALSGHAQVSRMNCP